jgi:hypothetical protein
MRRFPADAQGNCLLDAILGQQLEDVVTHQHAAL